MKSIIFIFIMLLQGTAVLAQNKLLTRTGAISFYSKAPLENIEAHTKSAISVLDKNTGQIEFGVLIKSFVFEKALMQEHFNENYLESDRFPKAVFKGRIEEISKIDFTKDGKYTTTANGQLTIHGETKHVIAAVTFTVQKENIIASTEFSVALADYKIITPALVKEKISETVKIVLNINYVPFLKL